MCAINGSTGSREEAVARMNAATHVRGPDGTRVWSNGKVTLGFNRLAIIDLSERAMQPMHHAGRYSLVFNGEIYNFRELRAELSAYPFTSDGDAEVVLAAYVTWGKEAFNRLNGMFALALYDAEADELVLARDSAGIKPLYYAHAEGALWFSSEAPALFAVAGAKVHQAALAHYLRLLYVPGPLTLVDGVRRVMPGEVLSYAGGALTRTMINTPPPPRITSYQDAVVAVEKTVRTAVERQLVSDRPVGLFLSGGLDSSIVAVCAAAVHPSINTFSVRFGLRDAREDEKFNRDACVARSTARALGTTHHEFSLTDADAALHFTRAVERLHQPVGNATALAQLFLSEKTRDIATVVLTGDGGDELFGGYERYRLARRAEVLSRVVPQSIARLLPYPYNTLHARGVERYAQLMFQQSSLLMGALGESTEALFSQYMQGDVVRDLMRADEHTWLVDEALLRTDAMSMAASIEARVPLLDREVVALAHALPQSYLVTATTTKRVLRDAFRAHVPEAVLSGPKRGWFSPGAKWLRSEAFAPVIEEVLGHPSAWLNLPKLRSLLDEHRNGAYHYHEIWSALTVHAWMTAHRLNV